MVILSSNLLSLLIQWSMFCPWISPGISFRKKCRNLVFHLRAISQEISWPSINIPESSELIFYFMISSFSPHRCSQAHHVPASRGQVGGYVPAGTTAAATYCHRRHDAAGTRPPAPPTTTATTSPASPAGDEFWCWRGQGYSHGWVLTHWPLGDFDKFLE